MRQISIELQKDDPLKRIQAEINEVERRERELREKKNLLSQLSEGFGENAIVSFNSDSLHSSSMSEKDTNDVSGISDDSGISSSSSPINGQSSNSRVPVKYVRSQTLQNNSTKQTPLSRAISTPQIFVAGPGARFNPAQKGIMQRFLASRGRIATNNSNAESPLGQALKNADTFLTSTELNRSPLFALPLESVPPIIERDEDGRPVRRGYVPVEEKIQKELREMRSRETELKRIRRSNKNALSQSEQDLLDKNIEDMVDYGSGEESEEEHCCMPRKLRSCKSVGELCDSITNSSLSPRETPSPQFHQAAGRPALKPAVSLAQLCDVDPDETSSSHRLIAQWENIIQQNQ